MVARLSQLLRACEFEAGADARSDPQILGVSTDTRRLRRGELFVALTGDNFDGHDFIPEAVARGAAAVIAEKGRLAATAIAVPLIEVESTVHALGAIALYWRRQCKAKIVAVTGSAGKTTTKDMIAAILSNAGSLMSTHATENNEIGVAQTLLRMSEDADFCVLEFGMRGVGEIDYLARISRPDVAVITNIGEAHIGRLGSREAVAQAKAEVLHYLPENGVAVLNADDFFFGLLANMTSARVVSFGCRDADVVLEDVSLLNVSTTRALLRLPERSIEVMLQVPGRHNAMNAAAAAAAASALGIDADLIRNGLNQFQGSEMRSQVLTAPRGYTVINDAYNASPTSVRPALEVLTTASGRKMFVFGDMLELGPTAEEAHRNMGELAAECGIDILIGVGQLAALAARAAAEAGVETYEAEHAAAAAKLALDVVRPGDTVLVKGSRGMELETVVEELMRLCGR